MLVNQPAILSGAFAAEGDKNTIPANNDGLSGLASIAKGFPPITQQPLAQGGLPPQRQDFNGIFNLFSQFLLYAQNGGVYVYNNTLDYQPPAIIASDNVFYQCVAENGSSTSAGVQPVTNTDYWKKLVPDVAVMTGATSSEAGASGLVPAPTQGQQKNFLTGAGVWQAIATTEQAQTGTDDSAPMTALKVKQAIDYQKEAGILVGDVVYRPYLADGYVKANGATVNRSDYPNLVTFATENNMWYSATDAEYIFTGNLTADSTTITGISAENIAKLKKDYLITGTNIPADTTITEVGEDSITISNAVTATESAANISFGNISNFPYFYGKGDGTSTFVLPDYRGRFIMGGDNNATLPPALPNIIGSFSYRGIETAAAQLTGAFYDAGSRNDNYSNHNSSRKIPVVGFDASRCSTAYVNSDIVRPPAFSLIPQIKY